MSTAADGAAPHDDTDDEQFTFRAIPVVSCELANAPRAARRPAARKRTAAAAGHTGGARRSRVRSRESTQACPPSRTSSVHVDNGWTEEMANDTDDDDDDDEHTMVLDDDDDDDDDAATVMSTPSAVRTARKRVDQTWKRSSGTFENNTYERVVADDELARIRTQCAANAFAARIVDACALEQLARELSDDDREAGRVVAIVSPVLPAVNQITTLGQPESLEALMTHVPSGTRLRVLAAVVDSAHASHAGLLVAAVKYPGIIELPHMLHTHSPLVYHVVVLTLPTGTSLAGTAMHRYVRAVAANSNAELDKDMIPTLLPNGHVPSMLLSYVAVGNNTWAKHFHNKTRELLPAKNKDAKRNSILILLGIINQSCVLPTDTVSDVLCLCRMDRVPSADQAADIGIARAEWEDEAATQQQREHAVFQLLSAGSVDDVVDVAAVVRAARVPAKAMHAARVLLRMRGTKVPVHTMFDWAACQAATGGRRVPADEQAALLADLTPFGIAVHPDTVNAGVQLVVDDDAYRRMAEHITQWVDAVETVTLFAMRRGNYDTLWVLMNTLSAQRHIVTLVPAAAAELTRNMGGTFNCFVDKGRLDNTLVFCPYAHMFTDAEWTVVMQQTRGVKGVYVVVDLLEPPMCHGSMHVARELWHWATSANKPAKLKKCDYTGMHKDTVHSIERMFGANDTPILRKDSLHDALQHVNANTDPLPCIVQVNLPIGNHANVNELLAHMRIGDGSEHSVFATGAGAMRDIQTAMSRAASSGNSRNARHSGSSNVTNVFAEHWTVTPYESRMSGRVGVLPFAVTPRHASAAEPTHAVNFVLYASLDSSQTRTLLRAASAATKGVVVFTYGNDAVNIADLQRDPTHGLGISALNAYL